MATIWGVPFTICDLRLPLPVDIVPPILGAVDDWGMPVLQSQTNYLDLKVKVKPVKREGKTQELSLDLSRIAVLYEGNVVSKNPVNGVIIPKTVTTGIINGEKGEIVILPVGQSSLEIVRNLLGEKIKFEFTKTLANI